MSIITTPSYKVGDRVVCTKHDKTLNKVLDGEAGHVVAIDSDGDIRVRFDNWADGHGVNRREWIVSPKDLEPEHTLTTRPAHTIVSEARTELDAAIAQMLPSDDRIICDRVKRAHALLSTIETEGRK